MTTQKTFLALQKHDGFFGDAQNHQVITKDMILQDPNFNWEVVRGFSQYNYQGETYMVDGKYRLVREDAPSVNFHEVGENYDIFQNTEMVDWLEPYLDRNYLSLAGYGYFDYGKNVFIQAFNDFHKQVNGDDISHYFLMRNFHGGGCIEMNFCTMRVICQNTLNVASKQGIKISIRHGSKMRDTLETIHKRIDLAKESFDSEVSLYEELARKPMTLEQFRESLINQFSKELKNREKRSETKGEEHDPMTYPIIRASMNNWNHLEDIQHLPDNAWKAFNAFNYCLNHGHGSSATRETCLERFWYRDTNNDKNRSYMEQLLKV